VKYCFCTIAIGETYYNSAINFAKKLNVLSNNHHYIIVTDNIKDEIPNTTFVQIPNNEVLFIGRYFNYNLKYYPIKCANNLEFDYIIFVDSDWKLKDTYNETSIIKLFKFMNEKNFDFLFERPHLIGDGKHDGSKSFWRHKIEFYDLLNTDIYDKGHVVNEQFLVFKNNEKLKLFIDEWERLKNIATYDNLWPFAEGVEIGMSSALSKMNGNYQEWEQFIRNFFQFETVDGRIYDRF
jgi:hypothetical protein